MLKLTCTYKNEMIRCNNEHTTEYCSKVDREHFNPEGLSFYSIELATSKVTPIEYDDIGSTDEILYFPDKPRTKICFFGYNGGFIKDVYSYIKHFIVSDESIEFNIYGLDSLTIRESDEIAFLNGKKTIFRYTEDHDNFKKGNNVIIPISIDFNDYTQMKQLSDDLYFDIIQVGYCTIRFAIWYHQLHLRSIFEKLKIGGKLIIPHNPYVNSSTDTHSQEKSIFENIYDLLGDKEHFITNYILNNAIPMDKSIRDFIEANKTLIFEHNLTLLKKIFGDDNVKIKKIPNRFQINEMIDYFVCSKQNNSFPSSSEM